MKKCLKCGKLLKLTCFYIRPRNKSGFEGTCTKCLNTASRRWKKVNKAQVIVTRRKWRNNNRKRHATLNELSRQRNKIKVAAYLINYRSNNKLKILAHKTVNKAIKEGSLIKRKCCICGKPKSEAHHDDYSKPLDVKWLCRPHHKAWHRIFLME